MRALLVVNCQLTWRLSALALPSQAGQFDFGDVEPTAVLVGVEVSHHQDDLVRVDSA